jgi:hypothetical protein
VRRGRGQPAVEHRSDAPPRWRRIEADVDALAAQWDGLHARRLAVRPDAVELTQARDSSNERVGAACDDDVRDRVSSAVDLDRALPGQPSGAAQDADPRSLS